MRIVSLLPAATEILYAIGAGDDVVGITHECDFPPEAARKPALIRPRVDPQAPPAELDRQVREITERGESIYAVDAELLERLAPDLIVTQDLCHVCAASPEDLAAALARLPQARQPRVVTFTPRLLADVWQGIRDIGRTAGREAAAGALAARLDAEVAAIAAASGAAASGAAGAAAPDVRADRPRVLCLEWFSPPYFAGHWVPEMVRLAGGRDVLGREGEPSVAVEWQRIIDAQPQVIVLMSCGYNLARNIEVWREFSSAAAPAGTKAAAKATADGLPPEWEQLPAVRNGRVYAVDANSYFSRSGPRLAQGTALLARLVHPERRIPGWDLPESRAALGQMFEYVDARRGSSGVAAGSPVIEAH